jgi:filamentous hemagglutinin family protein
VVALAFGIGGAVAGISDRTLAQITPDATLGTENSIVTPNVNIGGLPADRIDGGAVRGANLFHSFSDFNVGEGLRVYFGNPAGIENILSRVTGNNVSNILGTLGVDGAANLFLLNPNGIIFGPNAQLDIAGSFVASTANSVVFGNGIEFSATNPQAPPLLTISVPLGLQYGTQPPQAIENAGNLTVGQNLLLSAGTVTSTGQLSAPVGQVAVAGVSGDVRVQDVTAQTATLFASGNLILEESKLQTTGNLSLLAEDTVRVRDSVEKPFLAQAGGNLYIQGNQGIDILALNHPETPFQSGGNLTLVSDGDISGDAHFSSGGNYSILNLAGEPGKFVSYYDPIISANGNVAFGDYTVCHLR